MGMASSTSPHNTDIDFSFLPGNVPSDMGPDPEQPEGRQKRRKRAGARQKTPEQLYAALIKSGDVRVVRRKGKPPLIEWL